MEESIREIFRPWRLLSSAAKHCESFVHSRRCRGLWHLSKLAHMATKRQCTSIQIFGTQLALKGVKQTGLGLAQAPACPPSNT